MKQNMVDKSAVCVFTWVYYSSSPTKLQEMIAGPVKLLLGFC